MSPNIHSIRDRFLGTFAKILQKGYSIMRAVRGHSSSVIATVCVVFAACLALLLSVGVNGQLSSDWVSELGSSRDGWFDLGIESSSATEMCDEESWGECGATVDEENENVSHGRLLRRIRYYISYGALAADRIPCPPRSGRSYYTRNCYRTAEPVRPYHRSCTAITRCFRDTA